MYNLTKAFKNLGFINRTCDTVDPECLKVVYLVLVHSGLEFGLVIGNP